MEMVLKASRCNPKYSLNYSSNNSMGIASNAKEDGDSARIGLIRKALSLGPRPVDELLGLLQISQATFSRTIQSMAPEVLQFRVSGQRTPRYALVRTGPVASPQPLFRVGEDGKVGELGSVIFLQGGGTWVDLGGPDNQLHEGLPPAMTFAAPSGYVGARIARAVAMQLAVPSSLRDWSVEHRVNFCVLSVRTWQAR